MNLTEVGSLPHPFARFVVQFPNTNRFHVTHGVTLLRTVQSLTRGITRIFCSGSRTGCKIIDTQAPRLPLQKKRTVISGWKQRQRLPSYSLITRHYSPARVLTRARRLAPSRSSSRKHKFAVVDANMDNIAAFDIPTQQFLRERIF
jgi:hypothetical protein